MSTFILPYNMVSASAKELADYLGARRIRPDVDSRWKNREDKYVINWGSSKVGLKHLEGAKILNSPEVVNVAADKLKAFEVLKAAGTIPIPDFTTSKEEAESWIDAGEMVVARTVLRGHSGDGIVIAATKEELVDAPLYTKYFKKKTEYRFHVVGNRVVDVARKARKMDVADEAVNWQIRNLKGGFIYARENVNYPPHLGGYAIETIQALGLDFGAVDIIYNVKKEMGVVLEVNCAPGLAGQTIGMYGDALSRLIYHKWQRTSVFSRTAPGDIKYTVRGGLAAAREAAMEAAERPERVERQRNIPVDYWRAVIERD